jgi:hypothetical protein
MPSFHAGDALPVSKSEPGDVNRAEQRAMRWRRSDAATVKNEHAVRLISTVFTELALAGILLPLNPLPTIE